MEPLETKDSPRAGLSRTDTIAGQYKSRYDWRAAEKNTHINEFNGEKSMYGGTVIFSVINSSF